MRKVIHFDNRQDRLNFIRGKHTEIVPIEVEGIMPDEEKDEEKENKDEVQAD